MAYFGVATGELSVRDPATGEFTQIARDDYAPDVLQRPASDGQWTVRLRRPALGLDQLAIDQAFGDLDSVKRSAFAQVVRYGSQICSPFSTAFSHIRV